MTYNPSLAGPSGDPDLTSSVLAAAPRDTMTERGRGLSLAEPALASPRSPLAVASYGGLVEAWAKRRLGITLGPWQSYAVERILECDSSGALLARLALISVARQNGKSVIVRAIVGWVMDEGYKLEAFRDWSFILLAAHDAKQARIPYDFIRRDMETYVNVDGWGHSARRKGRQRVRATQHFGLEMNGIRVDVATRQPGSARGISPGLIAFDEVLTQVDWAMYEVLSPAQSAIKNSQMLMTSTAGFADSVVLRSLHDRLTRQATGAEQHDPTFMGLWWRADDDEVAPPDWDAIRKANPALGDGRLARQMIESEYAVLPRGSWVRERLNRWHDERVDAPFTLADWGACRVRQPLAPGALENPRYVVGVDVTASWSEGSVIVAAQRSDGLIGVEVHRFMQARPDTPLTAEMFVYELNKLKRSLNPESFVYVQSSALAAAMERFAVSESANCVAVGNLRVMEACHDFAEAVIARRIAHDDPHLDSQIAGAQRRFVGKDGSWRWSISVTPVTSVMATTLASMFAARSLVPIQIFL